MHASRWFGVLLIALPATTASCADSEGGGEDVRQEANAGYDSGFASDTPAPPLDVPPPLDPGFAPDPGVTTDPGFAPDPGLMPDPGFMTDPGLEPDPGLTTDPGLATDPGLTADEGTAPDPGMVAEDATDTTARAEGSPETAPDVPAINPEGVTEVAVAEVVEATPDSGPADTGGGQLDGASAPDSQDVVAAPDTTDAWAGVDILDIALGLDSGDSWTGPDLPDVWVGFDLGGLLDIADGDGETHDADAQPVDDGSAQDVAADTTDALDVPADADAADDADVLVGTCWPAGAACGGPGDMCSASCQGGFCSDVPVDCTDTVLCTTESCDPADGSCLIANTDPVGQLAISFESEDLNPYSATLNELVDPTVASGEKVWVMAFHSCG